jgi:hypothetical protein
MSEGVRTVAILASVGLGLVALFQLAIVLGAPLGPASWGGTHPGVLPTRLRLASAVAMVVWSVAAIVVLGHADLGPLAGEELGWVVWALVGLLGLGVVANAASSSPWERFGWAPFTAVLAVLCLIVAIG